jgi:chemotaxis protein histidine kinase CheA/ActR/RegA family two-component response regulator
MITAEQLDAFSEIVSGARDEFNLAYQNDGAHCEACAEQIDNLAFAAEMAEIQGLDRICSEVSRSITDLNDKDQLLKLVNWTNQVLAFIRKPDSPELAQQLVQCLPDDTQAECLQLLAVKPTAQASVMEAEPCDESQLFTTLNPDAPPDSLQALLIQELQQMKQELRKVLDELFGASYDDALQVLKERYGRIVQRLADTAQAVELAGLQQLCTHVLNNTTLITFQWLSKNRGQGYLVFQQWPTLVLDYLAEPNNDEHCMAVINHFELSGWPHPIDETESRALLELLLETGTVADFGSQEDHTLQASPEHMQLNLAEDLNADLFDAFLHDAPGQAAELSACMAALQGKQQDAAIIQQAQRITHTMKGAANIVGFAAIANMAHVLEDIFESLRKPGNLVNHELKPLLQSSADCMEAMVDYLQGKDELPTDRFDLYQQLVHFRNKPSKPQASNDPQMQPPQVPPPTALAPIESDIETNTHEQPIEQEESPQIQANQVETVRVPVSVISSLFQLAEEITIALGSTHEQTQRILKQLDESNQQDKRVQEQRFELENVVDVRSAAHRQRLLQQPHDQQSDAHSTAEFDSLEMDQYDEIYDVAHALIESVVDARELNRGVAEQVQCLDALLLQQTRLNKDLQRLVKHTRMVPVQSLVPRLQRCVRHAARITGKLIQFDISGTDTEINEDILEKLIDPIMHLLRNAVDHGIEDAQQRVHNNKSSEGAVQLSFGQDGQNIFVRCDDDGAGIDAEKVRNKAIAMGIINAQETLNDNQIRQLILKSGFSTKDSASQVSGRGVGMDAVYKRIRDLGGQLHILARDTAGTRVEIQVPLQLVASNSLLVKIQHQIFAIPTRQLDQILPPQGADATQVGEQAALTYNDHIYLTHHLREILGVGPALETKTCPILLTKNHSELTALYVDAVIANQDLVIKATGNYVKQVPGIAGVSILGDGQLVPVLDLPALLERNRPLLHSHDYDATSDGENQYDENSILIVDDSLSVRKSLIQLVNDAGYPCDSARDGLEAWEKIQQHKPAIILVDMEMPRMNGIELTHRIRSHAATQNIPVLMITSRSMQKHRNAAERAGVSEYFTKPFTETDLLTHIHCHLQQHSEQGL